MTHHRRNRAAIRNSALLAGLVWFLVAPPQGPAQVVHVWDLKQADQPGQLTIYNPDPNDARFGTPVTAGDLNGDGRDDLVISAMAGDGPGGPVFRDEAGEVAIYFSPETVAGQVDLREGSRQVVTLYGEAAQDIFGIKSHVADINGDGRNDLLVGAFYADSDGLIDAGKLYIFSGGLLTALLNGSRRLDLANERPSGITVVAGPHDRSRLGVWMSSGDVNGDGFTDVIVGADQADGYSAIPIALAPLETGRVYVLYGPLAFNETINLAQASQSMTVIYGVDAGDHAGSTVAGGDVNGDGFADVMIGAGAFGTLRNAFERTGGAGDGPNNTRENAGEVYVIVGRANWPREIDLRKDPPAGLLTIYGAEGELVSPDRLGEEIVPADVNGDGFTDMLLGAYRADGPNNGRPDGGEVYILYGAATWGASSAVVDMATPPPAMTIIYGASANAIAGDSIAAGDINGDGCDDLFIGVPGDSGPLGRSSAGGIVVIAGGPRLPPVIDLAAPSVPVVWVQGADVADFAAYWSGSGDLDGDGLVDAIPNGMHGDGPLNDRPNAGEAYGISGKALSEFLFPGGTGGQPDPNLRITSYTLSGRSLSLFWQGAPGMVLERKGSVGERRWFAVPNTEGASQATVDTRGTASFFRLRKKG